MLRKLSLKVLDIWSIPWWILQLLSKQKYRYQWQCMYVCVSHSVVSDSLWPCELYPARLLHGDFPRKNTGVGCQFLLQEIFLIQGFNSHILHWQADSLLLNHLGSPERVEKRDELGILDLHIHTVTDKIDNHQGSTV